MYVLVRVYNICSKVSEIGIGSAHITNVQANKWTEAFYCTTSAILGHPLLKLIERVAKFVIEVQLAPLK